MELYTKNGRPLQVSDNVVYSRSGKAVGKISGHKVFGTEGHYLGTIDGDRLVFRSADSAGIGSPFTAVNRAGSARANAAASPIWGDEPKTPD